MESVKEILPQMAASLTGRREYQSHLLFHHWQEIAGENVARHVRPARLDFSVLYLAADAPAWANELRYMERTLIDKINAFVCRELVKEIRFTADKGKERTAPPVPPELPEKRMPLPETEERKQAKAACEAIGDAEIRQAASEALAQNLARRRGLEGEYHACAVCGALCPRENRLCPVCERKEQQEFHLRVRRLLENQPWLKYHQIYEKTGASADIVWEERTRLMQVIAGSMEAGDTQAPGIARFVMLAAGVRPEELTDTLVQKILKRYRFNFKPPSRKTGKKVPYRRRF